MRTWWRWRFGRPLGWGWQKLSSDPLIIVLWQGGESDNSEVKSALRQAVGSNRVKTAPVSGRSLLKPGLGVAMGGLHPVVVVDADFSLDTLCFSDFDNECQVASGNEDVTLPLCQEVICPYAFDLISTAWLGSVMVGKLNVRDKKRRDPEGNSHPGHGAEQRR